MEENQLSSPATIDLELNQMSSKECHTSADNAEEASNSLLYYIEDNPPWYLGILFGLQHYLTMIGSIVAIPLLLSPALCIAPNNPIRGVFVSTIIFVSGIVTFLQVWIGIRLPIVQGGTFTFIIPTFAILNSFGECGPIDDLSEEEQESLWIPRVREIQGAIIMSSLFQIFIGVTGLIGLLLKWITPLTIVPTITLMGLSLSENTADKASGSWLIAIMTAVILMIFSQYLRNIKVSVPIYTKKEGFFTKKFAIFAFFPILLGLVLSWGIAGILTVTDALPANSTARTDIRMNIFYDATWFYVPYPFQFGLPTVSLSAVIGMLGGVLASMVESIGDYYACARICEAPSPSLHAINRGIGIEGLGCLIAGVVGTCNGTTSFGENIGAIKITGVGSRRVVQIGACMMIIIGMFGKFGAFFATIPDPVLAGFFLITFSIISSTGLSILQMVDLNSPRNLIVIGLSILFGLTFPRWLQDGNQSAINTGLDSIDQILVIFLSSPILLGGLLGSVLDNTIPGTPEERGLVKWKMMSSGSGGSAKNSTVYDLPFGMNFIERHPIFEKIPISPTYRRSSQKEDQIASNENP